MKKTANAIVRKTRGQGMTEYIIIVALVAICAIGIVTVYGDTLRRLFGNSADSLGGNTSMSYSLNSTPPPEAANKGLANFGNVNGTVY